MPARKRPDHNEPRPSTRTAGLGFVTHCIAYAMPIQSMWISAAPAENSEPAASASVSPTTAEAGPARGSNSRRPDERLPATPERRRSPETASCYETVSSYIRGNVEREGGTWSPGCVLPLMPRLPRGETLILYGALGDAPES